MERFLNTMRSTADDLRRQAAELSAQTRQDDADLTRIRANIYEICATVGDVVCKTAPEAQRADAYVQKLEGISRPWRVALTTAESHGDGRRAAVEALKLETMERILADFGGKKEG